MTDSGRSSGGRRRPAAAAAMAAGIFSPTSTTTGYRSGPRGGSHLWEGVRAYQSDEGPENRLTPPPETTCRRKSSSSGSLHLAPLPLHVFVSLCRAPPANTVAPDRCLSMEASVVWDEVDEGGRTRFWSRHQSWGRASGQPPPSPIIFSA